MKKMKNERIDKKLEKTQTFFSERRASRRNHDLDEKHCRHIQRLRFRKDRCRGDGIVFPDHKRIRVRRHARHLGYQPRRRPIGLGGAWQARSVGRDHRHEKMRGIRALVRRIVLCDPFLWRGIHCNAHFAGQQNVSVVARFFRRTSLYRALQRILRLFQRGSARL